MTTTSGQPGSAPARTGVGVFGGAFNPPHRSHVRLARQALERLPIRELRVIPSGDHPHKRGQDMAPGPDRLAMCRLAFAELPLVRVDDRELRRAGPSFTVDTLAELAAETGAPLWFLIGSDNLPLLATWREPERIAALCTIVTWPRAGFPIDTAAVARLPLSARLREQLLANVLELPGDAVAASDVRTRWRAGDRGLDDVPTPVRDYIAQHALYR